MNKILIAEDDAAIANLVCSALDGPDYRCTWAADGLSAAGLLEREAFDLALLDIMLPGADGYEVLDYCRVLEVPVIFLTAKDKVEDRVRGLRLGAEDYITKPFELMELLARVETVLRRFGKTSRVLSLPPDIEIDTAARTVREPLTLTDRISLYAGRFTEGYPALFSQANAYYEDAEGEAVAQETQELLIEAGIVPDWFFREEPFDYAEVNRLLLWDPEAGAAAGEPCYFWEITWPYYSNPYHTKSIHAVLDGESRLPVYLWVNDTNMAGWMPGGEEALRQHMWAPRPPERYPSPASAWRSTWRRKGDDRREPWPFRRGFLPR